jgi:CRISPR-associated protein Csy3
MAKNDNAIASVLAFEKKLVSSDGYLYGTNWEKRTEENPLKLIEKSVRGTISNRLKDAIQKDPLKLNAEVEKANLQKVDACALGENQDTLKLHFTLKVLGGIEKPSACNNALFNKSYAEAAKSYVDDERFTELARRYALNIANARALWRNRVGAEKVEVVVRTGSQKWTFDSLQFSLRHFDDTHADINTLAEKIAEALRGELRYLLLEIDVYALVGGAQEVYPSEELVLDKGKEDKSKILYSVNGVAAMHSQKIGNALRSIDTWYPDFDSSGTGPIAIEPYGAVTNLGKAYRTPKDKADFYTLFDRFALGEKLESKDQEHYVMAVLVRGGVFGQSSKE